MTSSIHNCGFDPTGGTTYAAINPLDPLKQNGTYDISSLVHDIVTKDFGYTGSSKYNLTLQNTKMVLSIWQPDGITKREFTKLELQNGQWTKAGTAVSNSQAVSNRLAHTLDRISKAAQGAMAPAASAFQANVNSQSDIHGQIGLLSNQLHHLSNSIGTHQNHEQIKQLENLIGSLEERIRGLQQDVHTLHHQNNHLNNIQSTVTKLSNDIPAELHEIKSIITQIRDLLINRPQLNSDQAREQRLQDVERELRQAQAQIGLLNTAVSTLQREKAQLENANELLQRNMNEANALSQKALEDLTQRNDAALNQLRGQLDQILAQKGKENHSLQTQLSDAQKVHTELQAQLKSLQQQLHSLQLMQQTKASEFNLQAQEIAALKLQLNDAASSSISERLLQAQLEAKTKQYNEAMEEQRKNSMAIHTQAELIANLQRQIESLTKPAVPITITQTSTNTSPPISPNGSDDSNDTNSEDSSGLGNIHILLQGAASDDTITCKAAWSNALVVNFALLHFENGKTSKEEVTQWVKNKKFDSSLLISIDSIYNQVKVKSSGRRFNFVNEGKTVATINTVLADKTLSGFAKSSTIEGLFDNKHAFLVQTLLTTEGELKLLVSHLQGKTLTDQQTVIVNRANKRLKEIGEIKTSLINLSSKKIVVK